MDINRQQQEAEASYWRVRALDQHTQQKKCIHCGHVADVAYSKPVGQELCKHCFTEVYLITYRHREELTAWKEHHV